MSEVNQTDMTNVYHLNSGSKGGGKKPHTPVETPNNLLSVAYAKVLIAVAEGELAGKPTDQDIFLDGTPLANADGSRNFGGVKWEWRPGTQDQEYIQGLPDVSTEYNVGVELKSTTPWVRQVTKSQLDAVRITVQWPALLRQEQNGDTNGVTVNYRIDISTAGGAFVEYDSYSVSGKTNTAYERTHRVDLPKSASGWTVRVVKTTPDSTSGTVQMTMNIKSIAEVVDVKQRYPNTALLFVEFDSRMFGGGAIPKVSVKTKGRIIQVPSNYDPETRTYSGIWNGTFKWAWSDNPAWVYYDIITQDRFGLGNKVKSTMVDKWSMYEIAQYCDVMVDDGHGQGVKEPRHTCNIYIQEKVDAWRLLRDLASCFNGMTYWNGNQFTAVADKREPINNLPIFSRSNVLNGRFDYDNADEKSIYTSALVSYDEPTNHYNTEVESSFETSEILRWGGDRQIEISAIGCTSRGEAQRRGKYTLVTNMFNRKVSFKTGLQGLNEDILPGKLIHVLDPLIGGQPFTGRIKASAGRVITLDREINARAGDILYITKANGISEGRSIQAVQNGNIVTLQTAYSEKPPANAVWYLETTTLKSQLFRVVKITSEENNTFTIEGIEYNDSKYAAVDTGARLEPRTISVVPPDIQAPPSNLKIFSETYTEQTMAVSVMTISWDQTENAVGYEGQWKVGDGDWVNLGITGSPEFNVKGIYAGRYVARVRAINAFGIKSIWSTSQITQLNGKEGVPPKVTAIDATSMFFGIRLDWYFPPGAEDTLRTEFMYSETQSFTDAKKLGDFAYPMNYHEMHGLLAGKQFWFWCRLIDRTGNIGPWFPTETGEGVKGQALINDSGQYNDYFAGLIGDTALDKELYDRIELIDGNGPGSVNDRLDKAVEELEKQIADITDAMVYDPTKTYVYGDIVRVGQKLYQAQKDVPLNTTPPNEEYWTDVGTILENANGLAAKVEINTQKITVIDGKLTSVVSSIESMQAAWRDDDGTGDMDDAIAGWDSRAQIITEREVRANETEAIAKTLVVHKAEIDGNTGKITSLTQVVADNESSTSTRLDALEAQVGDDIQAAIRSEAEARATADEALGKRIDTVSATMNTENQRLEGLVQTETQARVNADGALGQRIDTTQARVGENSAAIQQTSTAVTDLDGRVKASYTVKIDAQQNGQYVAAGIGLGIENGPAGLQSQFLVRADRFAVVDGVTTTTTAPFVVQNGQVFITKALIGEGWITNAMIGNIIQSSNFEDQKTGWQINKNGTVQINGNSGNGRMTITNNRIEIYDAANTLRVRMGLW